nr:hypothetical protein CFP56_21225 [Quercus suber]
MVDNHHEGYPGARIGQIEQAGLKTWNSTAYPTDDPNLVLIHAGTNDAYRNRTVPDMIADLDHLINTIFTMKPTVSIVLSGIVMNILSYVEGTVKAYSLKMEDLIAKHTAMDDHIVLFKQSDVSLYTGDNPQHLDNPTPSGDIGFAKMARNFFYGIAEAMNNGWI